VKNTSMPARTKPMARGKGLERGAGPERKTGLKSMSNKRRRVNRVRRKVAHETFGANPVCAVPKCGQWADDAHEPLTRARGGSITDPNNMVPLCRWHNDELAAEEPAWAYPLGLLKHSWDKPADGSLRFPPEWGGAQ
jgi:hypothetical protein